jgi:hypothetical protein
MSSLIRYPDAECPVAVCSFLLGWPVQLGNAKSEAVVSATWFKHGRCRNCVDALISAHCRLVQSCALMACQATTDMDCRMGIAELHVADWVQRYCRRWPARQPPAWAMGWALQLNTLHAADGVPWYCCRWSGRQPPASAVLSLVATSLMTATATTYGASTHPRATSRTLPETTPNTS